MFTVCIIICIEMRNERGIIMKLKSYVAKAGVCLGMCLMLCSCGDAAGSAANATVLEAADTGSLELGEVSNSSFSMQYPSEDWYGDDGSNPLSIYYNATLGTNQAVNINVQKSANYNAKLTEKDLKDVVAGLSDSENGLSVELVKSELRAFNGETVLYFEMVSQMTDAVIDYMLESGTWTQDFIDSLGGREVLLNIPPTDQIMIYAVIDGGLYVYTGTYYEADQKDIVLDCMTVLMQTTKSAN